MGKVKIWCCWPHGGYLVAFYEARALCQLVVSDVLKRTMLRSRP